MTPRTVIAAALLAAAIVPNAGCWMTNPDTPVIEAEDVRLDPPGADGFRGAGEEGEVYALVHEVSADTNGWVTEIAVEMSRVVHELNGHPEDRREGDWRVYGPHDDEDGADAAWMARISGDQSGSSFEVYLGRRGASPEQMQRLVSGEISVGESQRDGAFAIDFDTIQEFRDVIDDDDPTARYGGTIKVMFERDLDSHHKRVEIDFDGFFYQDLREDLDFDGERYVYRRDEQGAGQFHFATWSPLQEEGWSGPAPERVVVDMRWDQTKSGRARAMVQEIDGVGDLRHGDLELSECFTTAGALTWRALNEPYASYEPDYGFGEESSCVYADEELALEP